MSDSQEETSATEKGLCPLMEPLSGRKENSQLSDKSTSKQNQLV